MCVTEVLEKAPHSKTIKSISGGLLEHNCLLAGYQRSLACNYAFARQAEFDLWSEEVVIIVTFLATQFKHNIILLVTHHTC